MSNITVRLAISVGRKFCFEIAELQIQHFSRSPARNIKSLEIPIYFYW